MLIVERVRGARTYDYIECCELLCMGNRLDEEVVCMQSLALVKTHQIVEAEGSKLCIVGLTFKQRS